MKKTEKEDLRVKRTKNSIRSAFEEMICEMEYEQVSVKELTRRAKINRKTFYLHYDSLEDLLLEVQEEMVENFLNRICGLDPIENATEITKEFYYFHDDYGKFGERVTCSGNYQFLNQKMMKTVMEKSWGEKKKQMDPTTTDILMTFISESTLALFRQWINDGKKVPKERMIELTLMLIRMSRGLKLGLEYI